MEKRHGLGRGLGALLGEPVKTTGFQELVIELIDPNPQQPRQIFAAEGLADLERSIRELGVLVPIMVRGKADRYELIAGERRLRAARAAGLRRIPAMVREVDDERSLEFAVVENLQRENLNPIEEAMGFSHLMRDYAFTQERLAARLGKSRPAIANALRLLDLPDEVKALVQRAELSAGHARALLAMPDARRIDCAQRAVREGLSVRDIERLARREKVEKDFTAPIFAQNPSQNNEREAVQDRLRRHFGAAIRIVGEDRGHIEFAWTDAEDLSRLIDLLLENELQAS